MSHEYISIESAESFSEALKYKASDLEFKTMESFQLYDFHLKSYLDEVNPDEVFQFIATPYIPQQVNEQIDFKDYVPYQLKLEKTGLFPEFYYHFKKSFSAVSTENRAYCSTSLDKFGTFYVGASQDIKGSIVKVENDFEQKFRQCLHPELLNEFSTWYLTRSCVETKFRDKLKETFDLMSYPERIKDLTWKAKNFDPLPLVEFLMAYEHSENSVWHHVLLAFTNDLQAEKRTQYLNTKAVEWKRVNIPLSRQIQGFVKELEEERDRLDDIKIYLGISLLTAVFFFFLLVVFFSQ